MAPIKLNEDTLRAWPLPEVADDADKESRGPILVVGGSGEIAGAVLLAGTGALRAGAGKLMIATAEPVAQHMAIAVPEARVIGLAQTRGGGPDICALASLRECARKVSAAVVGPGMMDEPATLEFVLALLPLFAHCPVVLDALAMGCVKDGAPFTQPVLLTPHAGEMAHLTGRDKKEIEADPQAAALAAAKRWNAVVALKGAVTFIATPDGRCWRHEGGNAGLATSGSGDVLAGIVGGLAARGAPLEQACAWAVVLHAMAGDALAGRLGPLGYLARELPGEVPAAMRALTR